MPARLIGLDEKEAKQRLQEHGYNEIRELIHLSPFQILFRQIKHNFIVYLLFVVMIICFLLGKSVTAYTILGVIMVTVGAGFLQEFKAEKAIKALKSMIMPVSIVIRGGKEIEVPSKEIVPGDIVILRTGEKIPADAVVLEATELRVNESVLTGESREIKKMEAKTTNYKEENLLFMGTFVVNGKCVAKVLHSGMNTRFGKIAGLVSTVEKELPLQKKVNRIAKYMVVVAISISILTGLVMILRSASFSEVVLVEVLLVVIALSVSAFPEGFPVVLISTLAAGAYRMAKKNAVVNRMSIIETLGEATVVCSDKTGTITKGEMTARKIFFSDKLAELTGVGYEGEGEFIYQNKKIASYSDLTLNTLLKASVLCNDAVIERKGTDREYLTRGTPTEVSLLIMAAKAGVYKEDLKASREKEIPFSSERKLMSVLVKESSGHIVYAKGAPEILLDLCQSKQMADGIVEFKDKEKEKILAVNAKLTSEGLRTLALAFKSAKKTDKNNFEKDLIFLGLVGMEDPPRPEVAQALKLCREGGIEVKMITGDHKETALAISRQVNLGGNVVTGSELDSLTDEELSRLVKKVSIFARVKPEHKLRIVRALKKNGEIVTMTGDGVNDAPALKEAHIGIAMGKNGTDVSREVADLTLKDDNFSTIVAAIDEGRTVFYNIQKFVTYQLSCNFAELMIIFLGILLGLPLPLLALQILFMNLVTDNLPAITLGFNPSSSDVMQRKPRKNSQVLSESLIGLLIATGALMGFITLGVFYLSLNVFNQDLTTARTTALLTLICLEIANAFSFRSFRKGVLTRSLLVNKYLVLASVISMIATIIVIYSPVNEIFGTTPIGLLNWTVAISSGLIIISIFDFFKEIRRMKVSPPVEEAAYAPRLS
jgi:Ca2+-transporting ATPase